MSEKKVSSRIQNKHDTSTNWEKAINFAPLEGEIIIYDDVNKIKVGKKDENGNLIPVNNLPFVTAGVDSMLDNLISSGTADPSSSTASQYYFKYN